jgi:competence protein ComEA
MPSFTLTRQRALLLAVGALAVVLVAPRLLAHGSAATQASSYRPTAVARARATSRPAAPTTLVVVDVAGAVRRPGLYRLPQGSRIDDAIARAGGATRHADVTLVNLAAPLADGEQVLVPASVPGMAAAAGTGSDPAAGGGPSPASPLDLNSATAEELDALPGVGPATAQKIVDYRQQHGPYRSVNDLDAIPGIGPAKIANLKGLVIP